MSHHKLLIFSSFFIFLYAVVVVHSQDGILYPSDEVQNQNILPADNRIPVENRDKCDENELYYPGDQMDDWICDCRPAYLYMPDNNKCYPAFEKGPCRDNEYLVLPEGTFVPVCQRNPCRRLKSVRFGNRCRNLGETCDRDPRRKIGVNETTLTVECLNIPTVNLFNRGDFDDQEKPEIPAITCFKGCKRYQNMKCPQQIKKSDKKHK